MNFNIVETSLMTCFLSNEWYGYWGQDSDAVYNRLPQG